MDISKLNDLEKIKLQQFISDDVAVQALKKVLLNDMYDVGVVKKDENLEPRKNWVYGIIMNEFGQDYNIKNEDIGAKVRAVVEGTRALEFAFKELEKLKDKPVVEFEVPNVAR